MLARGSFKVLQISNKRDALTRFVPLSYFWICLGEQLCACLGELHTGAALVHLDPAAIERQFQARQGLSYITAPSRGSYR